MRRFDPPAETVERELELIAQFCFEKSLGPTERERLQAVHHLTRLAERNNTSITAEFDGVKAAITAGLCSSNPVIVPMTLGFELFRPYNTFIVEPKAYYASREQYTSEVVPFLQSYAQPRSF